VGHRARFAFGDGRDLLWDRVRGFSVGHGIKFAIDNGARFGVTQGNHVCPRMGS